jgi:predicted amidohydrolase
MQIKLVQLKTELSSKNNTEKHLKILSEIKENDNLDIVIFPELSLNGYFLQDLIQEEYFQLDDFKPFLEFSEKFDILLGAVLKEKNQFYNSALYFSKGKIIHIHRKVFLPNYGMFEEQRFFSNGKEIKTFENKFGKNAVVICEDLWNSKTLSKLDELNPDNIFVLANSPTRGFQNGKISIAEKWYSILQTTSILTKSNVIFINRVGFDDGLGFWGGSAIYQNGQLIKKLPFFDEVQEDIILNKSISNFK